MISINNTRDLENISAAKAIYREIIQDIRGISKKKSKKDLVLCAKLINRIETDFYENYDDKIRLLNYNISSDFLLCGDIYSNLNDRKNALKYYQRAHYFIYKIKSPYRDRTIKLLSFRSISPYSLSDLINNEITVCSPTVMNDPFDSIALLWASSENSKRIENGFRKTHEFYIESFKPYKIRCFSKNRIEDNNNILMWSHYANDHRGFCIEYTFTPDFIEQRNFKKQLFSLFLNVDYSNNNDNILKDVKISTKQAFTSKAECWSYENEVRLLHYNTDYMNNYGKMPLGNSFISAIYFGFKCSEDNIRLIKNILGKNISYYQMKQANGKIYTLEPVEI